MTLSKPKQEFDRLLDLQIKFNKIQAKRWGLDVGALFGDDDDV